MKRITAILLLFALSAGLLPSCAEDKSGGENSPSVTQSAVSGNEPASAENAPEEPGETEPLRLDELPEELNFDGTDIRFFSRSHVRFADEITVDDLNGEAVNDAIFGRKTRVEDRLGVRIVNIFDGGANHGSTGEMRQIIAAGSDEYDIFTASMYTLSPDAIMGGYHDWLEIPYVDTKKPYYTQSYNEKSSFGGHLYTLTGDISLSLIRYSFCMYFNKQLVEDYGIDNPYDTVREGAWTHDRMKTVVGAIYRDLNGNGAYDDDDFYGLGTSDVIIVDAYTSAYDMHMMGKDERDYPAYDIDLEKWADCVTRLWELNHETEGVRPYIEISDNNEMTDLLVSFSQDRMVFINNWIYGSESDYLRNMESDYGIIPYPKYDEAQGGYYTFQHDQIGVFAVPVTSTRLEAAGAVFEAMSSESRVSVVPAYYDIALKGKYVRDEDSRAMIDIIHNGHLLDPAWIFCSNLGDLAQSPRNLLRGGSSDFASYYASKKKSYDTGLKVLIKAYEKKH